VTFDGICTRVVRALGLPPSISVRITCYAFIWKKDLGSDRMALSIVRALSTLSSRLLERISAYLPGKFFNRQVLVFNRRPEAIGSTQWKSGRRESN